MGGGCRVPGATCRERGSGNGSGTDRSTPPRNPSANGTARPLGAPQSTTSGGPTLTGWPRAIGWTEFQDLTRRPTGEKEDAQIASDLEQPSEVSVQRTGGQFRLDAYEAVLSVTTDNSWVVTSAKSAALLAHEQGHYDITGLVARDMIADLRGLRAATTAALERDVKATIRRADALANRLTQLYDTDTDHGRTRARQDKWEALLAAAIANGTRLTGGPN